MLEGVHDGRGRRPWRVADSPLMPGSEHEFLLRWALGQVLAERFDAGRWVGSKGDLGALLYGVDDIGASANVKISKLLKGELPFPDRVWGPLAEFVGLTRAGLLRQVADRVAEMESDPSLARPPALRRGRPKV